MNPDLAVLVSLAAAGRIDRKDWQIIDAVHVRRLGIREAGRRLRMSHVAVRKRLQKVTTLCRQKANVSTASS